MLPNIQKLNIGEHNKRSRRNSLIIIESSAPTTLVAFVATTFPIGITTTNRTFYWFVWIKIIIIVDFILIIKFNIIVAVFGITDFSEIVVVIGAKIPWMFLFKTISADFTCT